MNFGSFLAAAAAVLAGFNVYSVAFRLVLAILLGGAVGINREEQNRPAGLRTHVLVCLGTALAMVTGEYIFLHFGNIGDPSRIGAQVVSGIGFLGAGTILISGRHVRGLTTAAGLWATACMGLAIGIGFYTAAIIGGLLIIFTLSILKYLTFRMRRRTNLIQVYVGIDGSENIVSLLKYFRESGIRLLDIDWPEKGSSHSPQAGVMLTLKLPALNEHEKFIRDLELLPFVLFAIEQE